MISHYPSYPSISENISMTVNSIIENILSTKNNFFKSEFWDQFVDKREYEKIHELLNQKFIDIAKDFPKEIVDKYFQFYGVLGACLDIKTNSNIQGLEKGIVLSLILMIVGIIHKNNLDSLDQLNEEFFYTEFGNITNNLKLNFNYKKIISQIFGYFQIFFLSNSSKVLYPSRIGLDSKGEKILSDKELNFYKNTGNIETTLTKNFSNHSEKIFGDFSSGKNIDDHLKSDFIFIKSNTSKEENMDEYFYPYQFGPKLGKLKYDENKIWIAHNYFGGYIPKNHSHFDEQYTTQNKNKTGETKLKNLLNKAFSTIKNDINSNNTISGIVSGLVFRKDEKTGEEIRTMVAIVPAKQINKENIGQKGQHQLENLCMVFNTNGFLVSAFPVGDKEKNLYSKKINQYAIERTSCI